MDLNDKNSEAFEKLSKAISNAIAHSEEVSRVLSELYKKDKVSHDSFLVLVFKMQSLSTLKEVDSGEDKEERIIRRLPLDLSQYVDGEKLTSNEIAFQEYCMKVFNEKEWLKKLGLILDDEEKDK